MNKRPVLFVLGALLIASIVFGLYFWPRTAERVGVPNSLRPLGATSKNLSVSSGITGACPLGWTQSDQNVSTCATAFGWTPAYGDAATMIFPIQNLAPGDDDFVTVLVKAQVPNAQDETGEAWWRIKWGLKYRADGGAFADPTGSEAGTAIDSQVGSQLTGSTMTLVQNGNQLGIQLLCSTTCAAHGAVDWERGALAPWVLSVSPAQAFAALGSTVAISITTTPGGAQYVSGGTVDGYPLSNCSQVNDHTAMCNLLAGTYSQTTGDVCITSQASPFCLRNGFAFDAGGPDTSVADASDAADAADASDSGSDAADAADAADAGTPTLSAANPLLVRNGDTLTLHGTGFATGTNTANFGATSGITMTSGGSQCTGGSFTTDNCATITVPSVSTSGSAFNVSVTRSGVGTSATTAVYSPVTATECQNAWVASTDTETVSGSNILTILDNTFTSNDTLTAVAAHYPTVGSVGGVPTWHFVSASGQYADNTTLPTVATGGQILVIASTPSISSGTPQEMVVSHNAVVNTGFFSSGAYINAGSVLTFGAATGAHSYFFTFGASGQIYQDNASLGTGTTGSGAFAGGITFGAAIGVGNYYGGDMFAVLTCSAPIASGSRTNFQAVTVALGF